MKNKRQSTHIDPDILIWLCLIVGILCIGLQLLISTVTDIPPLYSGLVIAAVFLISAAGIIIKTKLTLSQYTDMHNEITKNGAAMTDLIEQSDIPAVITHDDGTIIWYNTALQELLTSKKISLFGKKMSRYCPFNIEDLLKATDSKSNIDNSILEEIQNAESEADSENIENEELNEEIKKIIEQGKSKANGTGGLQYVIGDRRFLAKSYTVKVPSDSGKSELRNYHLTVFDDCTELFNLKDKADKENLIVAYIVLDNLEELAQYVKINYRLAANNIEMYLKDWAAEIGGVLCEYDRDQYQLFFSQKQLEETINDNFPILEKIRSEALGESSMSITVSVGISGYGNSVAQREQNAKLALDTALRRGGDQIVIKKENNFEFFGGRSKSIQKREKITSRVIASRVAELINSHSKIMVMGHKNPDCDSIGSCIGMAKFAKCVGGADKTVRIVVDKSSDTYIACTAGLVNTPEYKNTFITGNAALDLVTSDTLLIITDVNNFNIIECPELAKSISDIVIIDHHRKVVDQERSVLLEYIDPSASSASELISEMIESYLSENDLFGEEANALLAGIMLDTMNFTRSTGMRTFSAAYFLRAAGASPEKARLFFEDDLTEHLAEAKFLMPENVTIYRETMAIAISMGTDERYDRVAAAKAAERLITVRKVNAAFALVKIGDAINISARSMGDINVQLILETLHGGGHFDAAGAQVNGRTMNEVLVMLKSAINAYMDGEE